MTEARTTAIEFYQMVVAPTVADFLQHWYDHRLACLACLCLSALSDHYIQAEPEFRSDPDKAKKAIKDLRQSSRQENWAVGQVNDIANAIKHVIPLRGGIGYQDVESREIRLGEFRCGWPINGTHVMVEVEPGNVWLVDDLVKAADEWWRGKLGLAACGEGGVISP